MSNFILHIDTAAVKGLVMISEQGIPIAVRTNENPYEHGSFVQPAIRELLEETGLKGPQFRCLAVANGPGSYTGLRVGLAAAKGLCYAWHLPLCTVSSLKIMAHSMRNFLKIQSGTLSENSYLSPMIDARRLEVFYALYLNKDLTECIKPGTLVLDETSLRSWLSEHIIYFSGYGADKWKSICSSKNARFISLPETNNSFAQLGWEKSTAKLYDDIAYVEPFYGKEFYSPLSGNK